MVSNEGIFEMDFLTLLRNYLFFPGCFMNIHHVTYIYIHMGRRVPDTLVRNIGTYCTHQSFRSGALNKIAFMIHCWH